MHSSPDFQELGKMHLGTGYIAVVPVVVAVLVVLYVCIGKHTRHNRNIDKYYLVFRGGNGPKNTSCQNCFLLLASFKN